MAMMNMTLTLLRAQHVLIVIRDHSQKYQENQKIRGLSRTVFQPDYSANRLGSIEKRHHK